MHVLLYQYRERIRPVAETELTEYGIHQLKLELIAIASYMSRLWPGQQNILPIILSSNAHAAGLSSLTDFP